MPIRIRRPTLPELPRPASEIGAEVADDGSLRVWIQGNAETPIRMEELHVADAQSIRAWLSCQHEFAGSGSQWTDASARAAVLISSWYVSAINTERSAP